MRLLLRYTMHMLASALCFCCAGQNLVPNPSFEKFNKCPLSISGLEYSPGYVTFPTVQAWVNPMQAGSADYFNRCAQSNTGVTIPSNAFGYQNARTGNGYVGIIAWESNAQGTSHYAEYVQCKLAQPLEAGADYCVTFYVSNGISNATFNYIGIDAVGVNFSNIKNNQPTGLSMSLPFSMKNAPGKFLTDTSGWTRISGIFTATGGEEWMTLGWFDNGTAPVSQPISPSTPNPLYNYRCYLFLDDVSVVKMTGKDTLYTVVDTTICKPGPLSANLISSAQLADYKWNNGSTTPGTLIADTGTYWCVASAGCLTYIDTYKVHYTPAPLLELGKELINCNNQPVEINPRYPNTSQYLWSTGDTTDKITVDTSGTYYLTIDNECGEQTDTVTVFIQSPTPAPLTADTTVCQFQENAIILVDGVNLTWYTHPEGSIGNIHQPPIIAEKPGKYKLYVSQTIGRCESDKSPIEVDVRYTPHEELGDKVVMCENDLQMIGVAHHDVTYKWNNGSVACCVVPTREGLYKVATENDCGSFIDSIWVYHTSCEECITFPNAFTPISEYEKNTIFRPLVKCPVNEFRIRIYNRWGNKVYESNDVFNGWNGRYNYDYAPMGVYAYIVEYRAKDKQQLQVIHGNVTLIR